MSDERPWFSATQIDAYQLCPRKWGWRYLDKIPQTERPATQLGIAVHAQLEAWLRKGKALDLTVPAGEIALSGLHFLPAPKTEGLAIERQFALDFAGHRFVGVKDVEWLSRTPPLVLDHKTTSDFKWAKTPDDLRTNVQAALYAADAMLRAQTDVCELQWVYYRTKGARKAETVHLRVTREDVRPTLAAIAETADAMAACHAHGLKALDLPFDPSACNAFGGCDFLSLCNLTPEQRFQAAMSDTSSFLEKLRLQKINPPESNLPPPPVSAAGGHSIPPPPPAAPPPAPPSAPPPPPPPAAPTVAAAARKPRAKAVEVAAPIEVAASAPVGMDSAPLISMFDQLARAFETLAQAARSGAEYVRGL